MHGHARAFSVHLYQRAQVVCRTLMLVMYLESVFRTLTSYSILLTHMHMVVLFSYFLPFPLDSCSHDVQTHTRDGTPDGNPAPLLPRLPSTETYGACTSYVSTVPPSCRSNSQVHSSTTHIHTIEVHRTYVYVLYVHYSTHCSTRMYAVLV